MTIFLFDVVARHIRKKHPGCPEFAVEFIAMEVSGKEWTPGVKLGRAVGITRGSPQACPAAYRGDAQGLEEAAYRWHG